MNEANGKPHLNKWEIFVRNLEQNNMPTYRVRKNTSWWDGFVKPPTFFCFFFSPLLANAKFKTFLFDFLFKFGYMDIYRASHTRSREWMNKRLIGMWEASLRAWIHIYLFIFFSCHLVYTKSDMQNILWLYVEQIFRSAALQRVSFFFWKCWIFLFNFLPILRSGLLLYWSFIGNQ